MAEDTNRVLEHLDEVWRAYSAGDWKALRSLYHDEARLSTMAAHERIVGPDELMEVFRTLGSTPYAIGDTTVEPVDENAVIVSGELRYPLRNGGVAYGHRAWILVFRDGLLYRTRACSNEALARTAYRELGAELGL
jgi:hypothetical protein